MCAIKLKWGRYLTKGRLLRAPTLAPGHMAPVHNLTGSAIQHGTCVQPVVEMSAWADDAGTAIFLAVNTGEVALNVSAQIRVSTGVGLLPGLLSHYVGGEGVAVVSRQIGPLSAVVVPLSENTP